MEEQLSKKITLRYLKVWPLWFIIVFAGNAIKYYKTYLCFLSKVLKILPKMAINCYYRLLLRKGTWWTTVSWYWMSWLMMIMIVNVIIQYLLCILNYQLQLWTCSLFVHAHTINCFPGTTNQGSNTLENVPMLLLYDQHGHNGKNVVVIWQ